MCVPGHSNKLRCYTLGLQVVIICVLQNCIVAPNTRRSTTQIWINYFGTLLISAWEPGRPTNYCTAMGTCAHITVGPTKHSRLLGQNLNHTIPPGILTSHRVAPNAASLSDQPGLHSRHRRRRPSSRIPQKADLFWRMGSISSRIRAHVCSMRSW